MKKGMKEIEENKKIENVGIESLRQDFPQLKVKIRSHPLIYLDNAATSLKPKVVSDRIAKVLQEESSNIHRGAHYLSDQLTTQYEEGRQSVAQFISAKEAEEVIFTKGTTESINLVASSLGETFSEGDEILITEMEHHSNIIPWQLLCKKQGLRLKVAPIEDDGSIDLEKFRSSLTPRTRLASFAYISNVLGMENPIKAMVSLAKEQGALTFIDAAQAINCLKIDVQDLQCDFLAFSSHKVFGPFGVGVLWGKKEHLHALAPYQGGGGMISTVEFEESNYLPPPHRFEAGTPNICGVIGLKSALDYISRWDLSSLRHHEFILTQRAHEGLKNMGKVQFVSSPQKSINIVSFVFKNIHPGDMGHLLDQQGVAIRTGHHCAQPLMKRFGLTGTIRASFSIYNNNDDVDTFLTAVKKAKDLLS